MESELKIVITSEDFSSRAVFAVYADGGDDSIDSGFNSAGADGGGGGGGGGEGGGGGGGGCSSSSCCCDFG
jgi:hypothetical protein